MSRNEERLGAKDQTGAEAPPISEKNSILDFVLPTEFVDLPTKGKFYPEDHPLFKQDTIEIRYMTAKDEDILTSQTLLKKGIAIDRFIENVIVDKRIKPRELLVGDKNAVLIASRILAYGPEYTVEVTNPNDIDEKTEHTFDLSKCPFKELSKDVDYSDNSFDFTTSVGKNKLKFKLLTGADETLIEKDIKQSSKFGVSSDISTRLRYTVTEVDGDTKSSTISEFTQNLLARDSVALRGYIRDIAPDIDLTSEVEIGGETVSVSIPLTVEFFWPSSV